MGSGTSDDRAGAPGSAERRGSAGAPGDGEVSGTERTMAADPASQQTVAADPASQEAVAASLDPLTTGETVPGALVHGAGDLPELPAVDPEHYARGFEIARGGMGRVVVARDRRLGRTIAIKELIAGSPGLEARFEREVRITARLQHPSIITVHEAGRWPTGEPFYAMRHVEGQPLDRVIAGKKSYAERLALLPNVIAVADALAYAHDQRVIHRDLKPANVLLGSFGETVVIDWGLAKDLDARSEVSLSRRPESLPGGDLETVAGSVLGTPAYMSPEQARGDEVDARADVYAIGAILYTVLTGRPPYTGRDGSEALSAVLRGPPEPVVERLPEVAPDLAAIVDQAMARDPDQRYPDAGALVGDLKRFATGQLVSVHQYSAAALIKRWIGRHRAAVSVAAAAVVLMAVLGTLAITRIVDKERVARAQREIAEEQRETAQNQRALAEQRADRITLLQARSALDRDPTESLAWLKQVPIEDDTIAEIRTIAQRAVALGVAADVLRGSDQIEAVAVTADETRVAIGWSDGQVLLRDRKSRVTKRLVGVGSTLLDLDFSSDGQRLAGVAEDGTVIMWHFPDVEVKVLGKHRGLGLRVAFSHDDRWLASSAATPDVLVWDVENGTERRFGSRATAIEWIEFSPRGDQLATAGADGEVRLWQVTTGTSRVIATGLGAVARIAFSPDGTRLASASVADGVRIWPLAGGAGRRLAGARSDVLDVGFSPNGTALVAAQKNGTLRYWDLVTGRSRSLVGHEGEPSGLFFGPAGDRVISACTDGTVRVWDVATGDSQVLRGHSPIISLAVSPLGLVVSGDSGGSARIWHLPSPASRLIGHHRSPIYALAISPDGGRAAFAGEGNSVQMVDLRSRETSTLIGHGAQVWDVAFAPDGRVLASVGEDRTARLWNLEDGTSQVIHRNPSVLTNVAFSAGGEHVAFRGAEDVIFVWSRKSHTMQTLGGSDRPLFDMQFAPRGELLVSSLEGGEIVLFDLTAGTETVLRGDSPGAIIGMMGTSLNGRLLASCDGAGGAMLWNLQTGVGRPLGSPCRARFVPAFAPDGALVAYAAPDHSLVVEDLKTGHQRRLIGHQARVYNLTFFRDSSHLASTSADGTIRLWNLDDRTSNVLVGHGRAAYRVLSARNGAVLVTSGLEGDVRLWEDPLADAVPREPARLRQWLETTTSARVTPGSGAASDWADRVQQPGSELEPPGEDGSG